MSAPEPSPTPDAAEAPPPPTAARRRRRWGLWAAIALAALVALLVAAVIGARVVVQTEAGRGLVARLLEGLPLGPVGRLHVEGIGGDPLGDLKLARLEIIDAKGAWLDARELEMRWRYAELFRRRFHAQAITARTVTLIRQPVVTPQPPSRGAAELPVAVQIDSLKLALESRPAFSVQRGAYDVDGALTLERNMAAEGRLSARSLLHAGDGLAANFQVGQGGRVGVRADAVEGAGGALAGALGLPVDRPMTVRLRADGTIQAGALTLRTAAGNGTPLTADAAWGGGGARLTAQLALGASRLTRDLAGRAGPVARLVLTARHLHGDTFDVKGQLAADTARLNLSGPLDWKVRSTPGLDLGLEVFDASRWAPGVPIGSATLAGSVKGDPERFAFRGQIAALRLGPQVGYRLGRVAGPVALDRRGEVYDLQAQLAGQGGSGDGLVSRLLGPAPHADFSATRLADGRLLIRSLQAKGAGASVVGQGGQTLLGGGLAFKGSAQLTSLGVLQKGLKGQLAGDWTVDQAKGAKDWRIGLDVHASGFASGVSAADHFLGAAPRLKADGAWGAAGLQIAHAVLQGAALQATADGRIDPKGPLALNLGWQASGPFEAGPLHIAGVAKGGGRIGGTLSAPTAEVDTQVASLALAKLIIAPARLTLSVAKDGAAIGGRFALSGPSGYGPASLAAGFRLDGRNVDVHDLAADAGGLKAAGQLALVDGAPTTANLTLQLRPGVFISAGRLDGAVRLAGAAGHLALDGQGLAAPGLPATLQHVQLHADGPLDHLPLQLAVAGDAQGPFSFTGGGRLDQAGDARQLALQGSGSVHKIPFQTLKPVVLRLQGDARQLDASLGVGAGRADVSARQAGDALTARARLAGLKLSTFSADYEGALDATLNLDGRGPTLTGALDADLTSARSRDAPVNLALNGKVHAALAGQRLHLTAAATNAQGLRSDLDLDLPAVAAAAPFRIAVDKTRPMKGGFSADGELRPLWDLLIGGDQRLSGHVSTAGQLGGTLNTPKVLGRAAVTNGRYQNYAVGLDLRGFTVKADFGQDAVKVGQVSGSDGHGGTLSGSGDIGLAPGGTSSFVMRLHRFRAIDSELAVATMSGDVTITRDVKGQARLAGALTVDRADISPSAPTPTGVVNMDVVEINKPGEAAPPPGAPPPAKPVVAPPVLLDVKVLSPRGVYVKGKGLNVELSLDAHVGGSLAAPDLKGDARVVLGSYDFAGKRFDFSQSSVIHLGARPEDIRLNLTAVRQNSTFNTTMETKPTSATVAATGATGSPNSSLTAQVHVTGTAARPEITLSSTPQLPQDEILSQVLFGSSAAQLTGAQAAELASTLASLSGGGGFDVLGRLRQFAGLDRLAFGQGASGTGVSGGKYVTDNVYVELTGGGREGPSAAVEWRVRRNFSLISQVGAQGDAQLSIQYNKTFH